MDARDKRGGGGGIKIQCRKRQQVEISKWLIAEALWKEKARKTVKQRGGGGGVMENIVYVSDPYFLWGGGGGKAY